LLHFDDTVKTITGNSKCSLSFQPANIDTLFPALDALAWLDVPTVKQISQFAGIDPRTAGKLLANCLTLGIVQKVTTDTYLLALPYPYKGSQQQKTTVIREALVRMPLMQHVRQFMTLGDNVENALRKAATVIGVINFEPRAFAPLMKWARQLDVLRPVLVEDLVEQAIVDKQKRHVEQKEKIVAFLSHSSKDKPFVRQLATDLTKNNVTVWLDEQMIKVGESIIERVGQGLAESDYFLLALSENSVNSEWVKKELNQALLKEIEDRKVTVLPLLLKECKIPSIIREKKYADFSSNYHAGLTELIAAMRES
jgi:hypothetical protein